jgi:prephenate dehydrogenase
LALRRAGVAGHVVGCDRKDVLSRALEIGVIDSACENAGESVVGSDFVFLCVPVETSIELLAQIASRLSPEALVSDVGSTKNRFATVAWEIFGASAAMRVLPGHPLAGGEFSGLEHASAELFAGCLWVLTPLAGDEENLIPSHRSLLSALAAMGAHVTFSTPEEHDRTLAYTSHLPQMLSSALALTLEQAFGTGNPAVQVHAGGLSSMLRLAESDPAMWEQIAASNKGNLAEALLSMEAELRSLRESLGCPEFRTKFEQARGFARFVKSQK